MASEIKILIGGDPSGLVRASQVGSDALSMLGDTAEKTEQLLTQIGPAAQRAAQSMDRFKAGLKTDPTGQVSLLNLPADFKKIDNSARSAASGVRNFSNATSAGNAAVLDFSRVIQDLPFGLVGIVNNLTQLPGSLQRLSVAAKESGKSMASLLFSSISGFGGIGLILSVVTSGLLIFQNGIMGFGRAAKKAKEDADELKNTIRDIGDIQAEATGGVQGQIAQVQALAAAVGDGNRPYAERDRALEQLRKINKAYFGDLKLEDEATGKLAKSVDEYTQALIANAVVKKFTDEIANVAVATAKANQEVQKSKQGLVNASKEVEKAQARTAASATEEQISANAAAATVAINKETEAEDRLRDANEKVTDLLTQKILLQNELNAAVAESLKFKALDPEKEKAEVDLLSKRLRALEKIRDATKDLSTVASLQEQIFDLQVKITLRDAAKNGLSKEEVDLAIAGFQKELQQAFDKETLSFEAIPKVKFSKLEIVPIEKPESLVAKATGFDKKIPIESDREVSIRLRGLRFVLEQDEIKKTTEELKKTIEQSLEGLVGTIGEGIGNLFAGTSDGILKPFTEFLGNTLIQLGKFAIETGIKIKALKEALTKFLLSNPLLAVAAGVAAIAFGNLLKNAGKIPGFADGVTNFSGGLAVVGERGPELVRLPRGSDVVPNHLIDSGGNTNLSVIGEVRLQGSDILIAIERTQSRRRRLG